MSYRAIGSVLLFFSFSLPALAQVPTPTPKASESSPEVPQVKGDSSITFTATNRTSDSDGRLSLQPQDTVHVCLKLDQEKVALFQRLEKNLIGFRMILEDDQTPPHVLNITLGNRLKKMLPDSQGCFSGDYQVPSETVSGVFQVSDLLLARSDQSYYSVRNDLFDFAQVDEIKVDNPNQDVKPPELVKIVTYPKPSKKIMVSHHEVRIGLDQAFYFQDNGVGLDKKSLRIFYSVVIDDIPSIYVEPKCKVQHPKTHFVCKVRMVRPDWDWSLRKVKFALDSVAIQDNAGNKLNILTPEELKSRSADGVIEFEYQPLLKQAAPASFNLNQDKLY